MVKKRPGYGRLTRASDRFNAKWRIYYEDRFTEWAQLSIINKNGFRYPLAEAEKDYFLAVVLKILYASRLKDRLVFKGGTALNHLYLDQLRFSEDLHFATLGSVALSDLEEVFSEYGFLEIKKASPSEYSLKIDRLKFVGPLGQPNSLKIDIDLTQPVILAARPIAYQNLYGVVVEVLGMELVEICAEKVRAVNERARFREFYDLTMALRKTEVEPVKVKAILKNKELRKDLDPQRILDNLEIAHDARNSGSENLLYREELAEDEIRDALNRILSLL